MINPTINRKKTKGNQSKHELVYLAEVTLQPLVSLFKCLKNNYKMNPQKKMGGLSSVPPREQKIEEKSSNMNIGHPELTKIFPKSKRVYDSN
jgi:hypothetical protein